jgi:hypothetical protein
MQIAGLIECFLNGEVPSVAAADEAIWYKVWHDQGLDALPPVLCALQGGMRADRLPWVFVAGYQAAIRHVFDDVPSQGWAAYATTEDKSDPAAYPGTRLMPNGTGFVLDGCKSWVAQSRHLDHLLVTVNETEQCVLLSSRQPGVNLSHREAPAFLGAMSQGFARFEAVEVMPGNIYGNERMREFGRREPRFVMLAGAGYLLAQLQGADAALEQDLVALALALATACESAEIVPKTLAGLDRALQAAIRDFAKVADCAALSDWDADRRLLSMYSARIQKRALRQ